MFATKTISIPNRLAFVVCMGMDENQVPTKPYAWSSLFIWQVLNQWAPQFYNIHHIPFD